MSITSRFSNRLSVRLLMAAALVALPAGSTGESPLLHTKLSPRQRIYSTSLVMMGSRLPNSGMLSSCRSLANRAIPNWTWPGSLPRRSGRER